MLHQVPNVSVEDIDRAQEDGDGRHPCELDGHDDRCKEHPGAKAVWIEEIDRCERDQSEHKAPEACGNRSNWKDEVWEGDLLHHLAAPTNRLCSAADRHREPAPRKDGGEEKEWEGRLWALEDHTDYEVVDGELQCGVKDEPEAAEN